MRIDREDTIVALATAHGTAAIAVIRLSGPKSFEITERIFTTKKGKPIKISEKAANTIHFGVIAEKEIVLDEVLVSIFKAPHSFTGQDVIEISCHGSIFIQQQLVQLLIRHGARMANPGEFSLRAFLNGKFDLS